MQGLRIHLLSESQQCHSSLHSQRERRTSGGSQKNEPAKGTLDLPGGFVDMDETGEEGVAREVKEETGLEVIGVSYQFSIPNLYLYSDFLVHTLDMFYAVKVKDLSHVEAMDDAEESYWIPLSNLHPEEFGLGSIRQGVAKFLAKHKTKE